MQKPKVLIIGAGGHGRAVAESILLKNEYELAGFIDDSWPDNKSIGQYPIHGKIENLVQYLSIANFVVIAIGNNKVRSGLTENLTDVGFKFATIFHPAAIVSPSAVIGDGTVVMAGAIIGTEARLGVGAIVNSGANVDHHCTVGDFGHLGVNACMAGGSIIGDRAWIQAGSALGYGVRIDSEAIVPPGVGINI